MGSVLLDGTSASEITATSALRATVGAWRWVPTPMVIALGYGLSFVLLALALRTIDVPVAYATWAGLGTTGVSVLAALIHGERITAAGGAGIALIISGVVAVGLGGRTHG